MLGTSTAIIVAIALVKLFSLPKWKRRVVYYVITRRLPYTASSMTDPKVHCLRMAFKYGVHTETVRRYMRKWVEL